jgi:hypothetical protein
MTFKCFCSCHQTDTERKENCGTCNNTGLVESLKQTMQTVDRKKPMKPLKDKPLFKKT